MSNKKIKTNTEKMVELMEYSDQGALMQLFIISAIGRYAETVKNCTEEEWNTDMIDLNSWKRCAKEAKEKFNL